ncbi:MAG: thioredoxin domain-containing protein [Nitrospirae bacterium]|nr:thioredoxin domain-containing protein [Nitrospirota bacterium]
MSIINRYAKILATILILLCPLGCAGAAGSGLAANGDAARAARAERAIPEAERKDSGIRWQAWGPEAFARAATEDKLIFLDISASWCHWCKVMEETTYADPRVAEALNEGFVPVLVDTDARPDINDRYNQGGWPSVALLTPDGRVVAGRTTADADQLLMFLSTNDYTYHNHRDEVTMKLDDADRAAEAARAAGAGTGADTGAADVELAPEMLDKVVEAITRDVDPKFGGFGGPDKFPVSDTLGFGLYMYPKTKDAKLKAALTATLDGMAQGLMDGVEGGFFRYSTTPDWKSPHYEKLLSVNGELMGVYFDAYRALGDNSYKLVGEATALYMEDTLLDRETGAFFGSQAADESYYGLGLDARLQAKVPAVARVIYADENAQAATGFLAAYRATGDRHYLDTALGALGYVKKNLYKPGEGVSHTAGTGDGVMHLSDHVYTASAALLAYQATGDRAWLVLAEDIAAVLGKRFGAQDGGYYGVSYEYAPAGLLAGRKRPQAENCNAAALLMDLRHITGNETYEEAATKTLGVFAPDYEKYGYRAGAFALGVARATETAYELLVMGEPGDKGVAELIKMGYTFDDPDRVVVYLDPVADKARLDDLGYEYEGKAIMYVCSEKACFPPVFPGGSLDKTREFIARARKQEAENR